MKTLFERVPHARPVAAAREIDRELSQAQDDLEFWRKESEHKLVELAGVVTIDPRVLWNLDFCTRRVNALERARREMQAAEERA